MLRIDMGEHNVEQELDERKLHQFTQALLADLRARWLPAATHSSWVKIYGGITRQT